MRVLGIDPGTKVMGYGLVQREGSKIVHLASGALRGKGRTIEQRLHSLHAGLTDMFEQLQPDAVAVEEVYFHRNVKSAVRLAQAQALALVVAGAAGLPVTTYSPTKVKLAVVGNGRAHKQQVQLLVCRILSLSSAPGPLDVSDALAVAICHVHRARIAI